MPGLTFRMEIVKKLYEQYHKASKSKKQSILDQVVKLCGWHRKHAIRVFSGPAPQNKTNTTKRKGRPKYSDAINPILKDLWKATGYLCGQRLKAAVPLWIPHARQHMGLTPSLEQQLQAISPSQIDRRLAPHKRLVKRKLYGHTKPGSLLKRMIPVKTHHWQVKRPGFLEIDTVSHSGANASGDFLYTLNTTDIQSTWVERRALMGKSQAAILEAMAIIEKQLPFPLRGIDSDNGSEFINHHLWAFCRQRQGRKIQFTRSREYKKDDNAHIEQKNWTHVRQFTGWDRYDSPKAQKVMNDLYDRLRLFQNLFLPCLKLKSKIRKGSRVLRKYDPPKTPFQRLLQLPGTVKERLRELQKQYDNLNPFELSKDIDQNLLILQKLASRNPHVPRQAPPRRPQIFGKKIPQRHRRLKESFQKHFKDKILLKKEERSVTSSMTQQPTLR